jgi:hypothetical protein
MPRTAEPRGRAGLGLAPLKPALTGLNLCAVTWGLALLAGAVWLGAGLMERPGEPLGEAVLAELPVTLLVVLGALIALAPLGAAYRKR